MSPESIPSLQSDRRGSPAPPASLDEPVHTAILLLVFNRPQTTKAVLKSIRSVRPPVLFVAADGPRSGRPDDVPKCEQARQVATEIDWNCRLETLFRDVNLGAGLAIAQAITWFFERVPEGIILEDDCVPSNSFYKFCEQLLGYYRHNPAVMHISGDNFQYGRWRGAASYYFSRYTHSWGWATWRRAWAHYDFNLIPASDRAHIWDAQWTLSVERNNGLSIVPNLNMVTNIGFGADATHTQALARSALLPALEMTFPLRHPSRMVVDRSADDFTYYANFRHVPDLRLIPLYRAWDYVAFRIRKLFRLALALVSGRSREEHLK